MQEKYNEHLKKEDNFLSAKLKCLKPINVTYLEMDDSKNSRSLRNIFISLS